MGEREITAEQYRTYSVSNRLNLEDVMFFRNGIELGVQSIQHVRNLHWVQLRWDRCVANNIRKEDCNAVKGLSLILPVVTEGFSCMPREDLKEKYIWRGSILAVSAKKLWRHPQWSLFFWESPKSATLARYLESTRTFWALRSPWITRGLAAWRKWTPWAILRSIGRTSSPSKIILSLWKRS